MKIKKIASVAALLLASLFMAEAQTTLTAWGFDNVPTGLNASPSPAIGIGSASALGLDNSFNGTNSVSNPDVYVSPAGSSTGGASRSWRVRGYSPVAGSGGNGWSTNAAIGTQGAQFSGSTLGYYKIGFSFDVYLDTTNAEANLQVQYTTDGSHWYNAAITSAGAGAVINYNSSSPNTVTGSYVTLANGWNTNITVNLTGISGVDNNGNFAVRMVNASTGADCVDTTGSIYNNKNGSWTFDNVVILGTSIDTIAGWTFESEPNDGTVITNPVPEIGGSGAGQAQSIGFNNNYTYAGGNGTGSIDASDVADGGGISSSGSAGPNVWRVRGAIPATGSPGIGWNSAAPIGTQGAQFDVSTVGYSNIIVSFDYYVTSKGEAKTCVLYTTNGWNTTNVANNLAYAANPAFVVTNSTSPNTVSGTYFFETAGQGFYNNIVVDFTGVPDVQNNPLFGFRIANAAKGIDCVDYKGAAYNNSSGNNRFDNVTVGGTAGTPPPELAFDPSASVDAPFTNTFTDNPVWRARIGLIYVNGLVLTNSAYTTNLAGEIVFTPSASPLLQSSGVKNIVFIAPGFGTARVTQPLAAGVATHLDIITRVKAPAASGGTLVANPVLGILDQYNNGTTNPYVGASVTATVGGGAWTLGGDTDQEFVDGIATFTNLTATANDSAGSVSNYITFEITGYSPLTATNSASFNIGAAPVPFTPGNLAVLQLDKSANNTTFSIIEIQPSSAGQTKPVNIVPISATGSNALRMANSGSCGRVSLSDDGTLLCFAAFQDGSSATADETLNLNRAAAGLNYDHVLSIGLSYTSTSLGGSQARSCIFLGDNTSASGDWIVNDKGGLYEGSGMNVFTEPNLNPYNNVVVRTFGGIPYVLTQKVTGPSIPGFYSLGFDPDTGLYDVTPFTPGVPIDGNAADFYMISTNGGTTYDVLYILTSLSTNGIIKKFSLVSGSWTANGSITNQIGGSGSDSLFATTNGNGGVYLYMTTAPTSSGNNSVVRLTDATGWNQNLGIISSNLIYTASGGAFLNGLTFVPQQTANTAALIPPPVLGAQSGVTVGNAFSLTYAPNNPAWLSAITGITVNGSALPAGAYNLTQAGVIVFDPAQSALLQSPGAKSIVISAASYSDASVVQTIASNVGSILGGVTMNNGIVSFTFTNYAGLSFSVLGTNNLTAPITTWPVIGAAVENPAGSGQYHFADPNPATNSTLFYLLRQP